MKIQASNGKGVGRQSNKQDALILMRFLKHCELSLFTSTYSQGWKVSPTDECWICENWKYVLVFYERPKHIDNKVFRAVSKWLI